jgi:parallel beta-helix repeat protein
MGGLVKDSVIEGNTIRNCYDDGIQVEGRNENVRVRNNTITGCGLGIALAPNMVGPLYIEGNTITDLQPGEYGLQACFKLGDGGSGTAHFTGNTCKSSGDGFKQTNSGMTKIIASDNCIVVSRYVIELSGAPASGTSFNGNTLYTSDSGRFVKWNGSTYLSLSAFQSATGQEANGVQSQSC